MANVQIPNLPAAIALNGSEEIPAVQAGTTVRITAGQLTQFVSASTAAGGVNDGVQYNFSGVLASNANFTTDGNGNVVISGSGYGDGTLAITVNGQDAGQVTALTLLDNSNGADGVTQIFKTSGSYPDTQVSLNLDSEFGAFSIKDDIHASNILSYTNASALTIGDGTTFISLNGSTSTTQITVGVGQPYTYAIGSDGTGFSILGSNGYFPLYMTDAGQIQLGAGPWWNFELNGGLDYNGITGGNMGAGTINAVEYYASGVPIAGSAVAVASLPSVALGARAFVTDSTVVASGHFGSIVVGGGIHPVPVWSDGTNWYIG
jgi:hypothetical protein